MCFETGDIGLHDHAHAQERAENVGVVVQQLLLHLDGDLRTLGRVESGAQLDGKLAGFADMDAAGYLDRLYVRWDCQRRGVATALCDALEEAVAAPQFTTHASITAKGFFEKRGYCAIRCQQVQRGNQCLTNFVMVKVGR